MARRRTLRSQLYKGARDLGNLEAAEKGRPTSYGSGRPTSPLESGRIVHG
jgi:hypothetical protein